LAALTHSFTYADGVRVEGNLISEKVKLGNIMVALLTVAGMHMFHSIS